MPDPTPVTDHPPEAVERLLSGRALAWVAVVLGSSAVFLAIWVPRLLTGGFLMAPLMILPTAILGIVAGAFGVRTADCRTQRRASAVGLCLAVLALVVTAVAIVVA